LNRNPSDIDFTDRTVGALVWIDQRLPQIEFEAGTESPFRACQSVNALTPQLLYKKSRKSV
jgi:hypothetical protein